MELQNLQNKMHQQFLNKEIFNQSKEYAFDYVDKSFNRNVFPTEKAIEQLKFFDEELPKHIGDGEKILKQLHQYGSPATITQIGGRYFGFVNGGIIPVALAAKWLNDFWDQNTPLYVTSPIVAKLEAVVESWLIQIFNLPKSTVAGFVSGSSLAILCGLAAARYSIYKRLNWNINDKGLINAPKIRIVTGKQIHSVVLKAIALLGFGKDNIEWVDVDQQGRIVAEKIPPLDENTLTVGIEKANSWSVDGHKTLNTPYDSGIVLCKDKEALVSALQASGAYITYSENRDGMLFTPEMSRRARAVELWACLKYLIVACKNDDETKQTLQHLQELRECWCGDSQWFGKKVIRISVCSWVTTAKDVSLSVKSFVKARQLVKKD